MSGLYESTEQTMIAAHQSGMAYWKRNKPHDAPYESLASLARSLHWHGADNYAWLAGLYGAKSRDNASVPRPR